MKTFLQQIIAKPTYTLSVTLFSWMLLLSVSVNAQNGYIYIHKKALNEVNKDFSFSVTGGSTIVPNFTLNDEPTQISAFFDIGAAENGRLWAATNGGVLYYRDANSTVWVNTGIAGVARVDGGSGGTCYFINSAGTAFSYDGISAQVQISTTGKFGSGGGWQDISSGWTGTPTSSVVNGNGTAVYAVNNDGNVYKWNGPGTTTWGTYTTIGGTQYRVDVNPTNGNVYVGRDNGGSIRTILEISTAAVPVITSLGSPVPDFAAYKDIAVNQNGEIYAVATDTNIPQGAYVFKFVSGTTWSKELGSFDAIKITGGIANSLWTTQNSGGWNGGSGWAPATGPYPFYNIFSRGFDGTIATYIDDERVRTTTGNSELIAVAPGTYTITEAAAAGWDLQKILLYDPSANSTSNQVAGTATINVSANEVVHVVYQNGELNPIVMTNSCSAAYLETFGVGTAVGTATTSGSFGSPIAGQTSYHYLAGNAPGEDGYYKIVNRANPDFNGWGGALGIVDHTPGDGALGYMYAVNAGFDKGEFFRRRFTGVIPGATYNFSAWIIDLTASAAVNPNVSFLVLDHTTQAVLGSYNTGELTSTVEPDAWQQYGFSFVATAADIDLVIGNNGFGGNGNDLALDDISFALIPSGNPVTTVTHTGCGTLGSITVTSPVGSSFEYSKDGISWQDATSFVNLTPGVYTTFARFKGTVSCITSKIDTVKAAICGTVFNDANGNTIINAGENGTTGGVNMYVYLVDSTGIIVDSAKVLPNGTYTLDAGINATYTIELSTIQYPVGNNVNTTPIVNTAPTGWVTTGENGAGNTGTGDGTPNGVLTVVVATASVSNQNFGIQQPPVAVPDQSLNNVTGTTVTINPLANDSDGAPGTLDPTTVSLVVPFGATSVVTDAQGDIVSMTIPGEGTWVVDPATGTITFTPQIGFNGNPTVQQYNVEDNAGVISNSATITITYAAPITISGTVFNDANGNTIIDGGENGTSGGTPLYVYLVNAAGIVVDSAMVLPNGIYTLDAGAGLDYTIELSAIQYPVGTNTNTTAIDNTAPAGWVTTGENGAENIGAGDGTPNGVLQVSTATTNITNQNFGIEQPPVAVNDQSLNNLTVAPVTINPLVNDNDPSPGTLNPATVSLVIPAGATNVITDAQGDVTSITIPGEGTWVVDPVTGLITFTPLQGFTGNPTVQQYNVEDNAGVQSNNATLTITFLPPVTISGTIINDLNGNTIMDGTETGTTGGTTLYVYLVNASGIVVDSAQVLADGSYTLDASQSSTYTIELSTIQYSVGTNTNTTAIDNTAPAGWVTTGENGAGNTGSGDGTADGVLSVTTNSTNVTQQNFGIEQPPVVPNQAYTVIAPVLNSFITLNGTVSPTSPGPLQGNDPVNVSLGAGDSFSITSLTNMNGNTLLYNGVVITGPTTIPNYNPALLQVQLTGGGSTQFSFDYAAIDAAGVQGSPGTYSINWLTSGPLPVKLVSFTAMPQNNRVLINWVVADEINVNAYTVEFSKDGRNFETVGNKTATGSNQYSFLHGNSFTGVSYYRLKIVERDGRFTYSEIRKVNKGVVVTDINIYPNPASSAVNLTLVNNLINKAAVIKVFSMDGKLMLQKKIKAMNQTEIIDVSNLANGKYILKIETDTEVINKNMQVLR